MARQTASPLMLLLAAAYLCSQTSFVSPASRSAPEVDVRVGAAVAAGLAPLAIEQPAGAYDSVVAMLQSWLVGGTVLTIIFAAALVAATANPLTKRRQEVLSDKAAVLALGLFPLVASQPAYAYDSVVAMLQSWLVGGTVLTIIFAAALVAATANPLTKRRQEVLKE